MLQLLKSDPGLNRHEQVFVERYERMLAWAMHLTDHDRAQAEDLLHDAFIQFAVCRPDLREIQNLDGYLYGILRFLRLSQLRRASRSRLEQLSVIDYDSAEKGLRAIDPRERISVHDDLRAICRYACARKESSKAGSVLILRFFLGYYPSEIARVIGGARKVVDMRLQSARREARAYLDAPERLSFLPEQKTAGKAAEKLTRKKSATMTAQSNNNDLMRELRAEIFQSRRGECLSRSQLEEMYKGEGAAAIENPHLSHIVSCPACLDQVNDILGLPPLADRYPTDMTGPDAPSSRDGGRDGGRNGGNGSTPNGASGGGMEKMKRRLRRLAQDVFEHRPQELHIAVNGLILGSQSVHAELNEQTLEIIQSEPINFIEVFSEQQTRMLLLPVGEAPPVGPDEQSTRIELSDGRALELTLSFRCPHPTLQAIYHDPLMKPDSAFELEEDEQVFSDSPDNLHLESDGFRSSIFNPRSSSLFSSLRDLFRSLPRPRPVFAAIIFLLLSAALLLRSLLPSGPAVSAAELLRKSIAAEARMVEPTQVLQRTLDLEERDPSSDRLLARRRVEVWQGTNRGAFARRLYDERGRLVAGEWEQADGSRKIYRRSERKPAKRDGAASDENPVWRLDLSSSNFSALVGQSATTTLEERPDVYVLSYQSPSDGGAVLKANLTLNKSDLRAIEQKLLMRTGGADPQLREYRFAESGFKRLAADAVPANVFRPDPELLGPTSQVMDVGAPALANPNANPVAPAIPSQLTATELAALEVEARYLLDQAGAASGEQVNIERVAEGGLRVRALVDTDKRKEELLAALKPLRERRGVSIDIATYAEALRRQPQSPAGPIVISETQIARRQMPAGPELRRYFSAQAEARPQLTGAQTSEAWVEEQVARFASRMQTQAIRPVRHAWALKNLISSVAPEEAQALNAEARAKWLQMIRSHASSVQRETESLRLELQPIFFPTTSVEGEPNDLSKIDIKQIVEQLVELTSAHDKVVSKAFSASAGGAGPDLKAAQFQQSLRRAEKLAAILEKSE